MIDLHTHTTYSDGTDSLIDLLKNAEKTGLKILSITDHISCKAYEEIKAIDVKKYFSGRIIKGCEFFTTIEGQTIELLGYNLDTDMMNEILPTLYLSGVEDSKWQENKLIEVCKKLGVIIDYNNIKVDYKREYAGDIIHREIVSHPENKKFFEDEETWKDGNIFYRKCLTNSKSIFFLDKTTFYPSIQAVIDLIRKAGGLVFVPHMFIYGENSMKFFDVLTKNYKLDGFECYYSSFTDEQSKFLLNYCKENNLLVSGGSDYHGDNKPGINLGTGKGNLNIPDNITDNWGI